MKIEIDTSGISKFFRSFHPKASLFHRFATLVLLVTGYTFWDMFMTKMVASFFEVPVKDGPVVFFGLVWFALGCVSVIITFGDLG